MSLNIHCLRPLTYTQCVHMYIRTHIYTVTHIYIQMCPWAFCLECFFKSLAPQVVIRSSAWFWLWADYERTMSELWAGWTRRFGLGGLGWSPWPRYHSRSSHDTPLSAPHPGHPKSYSVTASASWHPRSACIVDRVQACEFWLNFDLWICLEIYFFDPSQLIRLPFRLLLTFGYDLKHKKFRPLSSKLLTFTLWIYLKTPIWSTPLS